MATEVEANPFEDALDSVAAPEPEPKPAANFDDKFDLTDRLIWDIETGPLPDDRLREMFQFDPSSVKGYELLGKDFDPAAVKLGRMKDEEKIAAKIQEELEKFNAAKAAAVEAMKTAESDAFAAFKDRAALSALTGQVLAIGYLSPCVNENSTVIDDGGGDEKTVLRNFWDVFRKCVRCHAVMIGFNTTGFDVPFIIRRSWAHRVLVPNGLFRNSRYLPSTFCDLREIWACGEYRPSGTLDDLASLFNATRKNGDGSQFHKLWNGTPEERQQAIDYLKNDLVMTREVADALQL